MTNDEGKIDVELREVDAQLRQVLRAPETPNGLAERVFDASVGGLGGGRDVVGWLGWVRYAAAAVLMIGVLTAVWTKPWISEPVMVVAPPSEEQVEEIEVAVASAAGTVDERIGALAMEIEEFGTLDFEDEDTLAEELIAIESELF